jgi:hypothetical protein
VGFGVKRRVPVGFGVKRRVRVGFAVKRRVPVSFGVKRRVRVGFAVKRRVRVGFADVQVALRQTLKHVTGACTLPTEVGIAKIVTQFLRILFGYCSMS